MFRIDVIRQFRVKVGGRSRFSPMRIVLVSIPLYFAPIFLAPGGGNGKPSKYLGASIYPRASGRRRERLEEERATGTRRNRDRDERRGQERGTKSPYQKQFLRPGAGAIPKSDCQKGWGDEGLKMGRGGKPTCLSGLLESLFFSKTTSPAFPSRGDDNSAQVRFTRSGENASVSLHDVPTL